MAHQILEIGTGIGDVTLTLATSLPAGGLLITIEASPDRAAQARKRFADAALADRISVIVGEPKRFLHKVRGPFDLIVQHDADDRDGLHDTLIALLAPGGVLIRGNKKYSV
jgi:predicted O-methyltransferase YrrM